MSYRDINVASLYFLFRYEPSTGKLLWKARPEHQFKRHQDFLIWNGRFAGTEAGTPHVSKKSKTSYRMVKVCGYMVLTHLIVWAMAHGRWAENTIDHVDQDGLNNRLNNLREATQTEQLKNRPKRKDNTSGKTGVSWHKASGSWYARISVEGKEVSLGLHDSLEAAVAARMEAERKYGYKTGEKEGYASIDV